MDTCSHKDSKEVMLNEPPEAYTGHHVGRREARTSRNHFSLDRNVFFVVGDAVSASEANMKGIVRGEIPLGLPGL